MGEKSKIEWTDSTWNPIRARQIVPGVAFKPKIGWHCEHVSEGCRNCYAESMNRRLGTGLDFKPGHRADVEIFLDEKMLLAPLRWKTPRRIFVNSMTDTFAEFVKDEWLDRMFAVMALAPQHTFQVLTKRPERMLAYMDYFDREAKWMGAVADLFEVEQKLMDRCYPIIGQRDPWLPLPNVWLGVSAEDQATFEERRQPLCDTPAAVRFFSFEPLLGPIDARDALATGLYHWAIAGGESGPHARPMHPDWARSLRNQCANANVPFFFKQWGEWAPHTVTAGGDLGGDVRSGHVRIVHPTGQTDVEVSESTGGHGTIPGSRYMARVGKKTAGRLLDGREHNGTPSALRETAQSAVQPTESS